MSRLGREVLDRLNGLFVGTIHAYCFRLLQQHVPKYETYDVLDENQLAAFVSREARRLNVRQFDPKNRLFASIRTFLRSVEVVDNELLDLDICPKISGSSSRTTTPPSLDTGCLPTVSRFAPRSRSFRGPTSRAQFTRRSDS